MSKRLASFVPDYSNKRVSPHVLRHTCAMIVLQATQDIRKVSLWLGHATLASTEIYTRGDPTEKLEAIEAIVPPHLPPVPPTRPIWREPANCSPRHRGRRLSRRQNHSTGSHPVPVAEAE